MAEAPRSGPPVAALIAFGASLARRGIVAPVAMGVSGVTVFAFVVLAVGLGARGGHAPLQHVPGLAAVALAWGGGFLQAFAVAAHAFRRDREQGIRQLAVAHTRSLRGYLVARVGGLAAVLALVVGGGTLAVGLAATIAAARLGIAARALQATAAGVVFALAFAAVLAPVAFASLGARSRVGGYAFLVMVVVLPELVVSGLEGIVPARIIDVLAIPAALGALRDALSPGTVDAARFGRALVALSVFAAVAVVVCVRQVARLDRAEVDA